MREKQYFIEAKKYLLSFNDITEDMLDRQLTEWKVRKPNSIEGLFRAFLMHAQNRQGMPNSIGDIDKLSDILFQFNPAEVASAYTSWDEIFDKIQSSGYTPPGRMDKKNSKNYWVIYCKAILSIAHFLNTYRSIEDFNKFIEGFYINEHSRVALPLLLEKEIFGFGFALACDCLKESGYPDFVKPDTHINDIARELGITTGDSDYQVFKDVVSYCQRIEEIPYEVDKLFWLVGSGDFYLSKVQIKSSKREYLEKVKSLQ